MSPQTQTLIALFIVAITATWFGWRALAKRKTSGCGGNCGCPASALKTKLKS